MKHHEKIWGFISNIFDDMKEYRITVKFNDNDITMSLEKWRNKMNGITRDFANSFQKMSNANKL